MPHGLSILSNETHANLFMIRCRHPSELHYRDDGSLVENPYHDSKARLENEFNVIQFLKATAPGIPLPEAKLLQQDGLLALRTTRATGICLGAVDDAHIDEAVRKVTEEMMNDIIPTLQAFRSTELGGLNRQHRELAVPARLPYSGGTPHRVSMPSPDFVLCHNDLSQGNIFVDPQTLKITCIIDWEYAGYFPKEFEVNMWKYRHPIPFDELGSEKLWQKLVSLGAIS